MKFWIACWLLLFAFDAQAHKPSDSYLTIDRRAESSAVRWDIALRDLDFALNLDSNDDGAISWSEVRSRQTEIATYAGRHLRLAVGARDCPLSFADLLIDEHTDGRYAVLMFNTVCGNQQGGLSVDYRLFFDIDPQHRGLLRLETPTGTQTAVFSPTAQRRSFPSTMERSLLREAIEFAREGIWHIWIGYDHILFLLSLLLPSVLVRQHNSWRRSGSFRESVWDALKVVSAFTLAHSITLSLAALDYVDLPSRWVEAAIAASVIFAALHNLWPLLHDRRASLAFTFGLVHGLGFASVLSDLGLPSATRLSSLLAFNGGVEIGQLAIVCAFLPLAHGLSRFPIYQTAILRTGSLGIAVVATSWFLERAAGQ